MTLGTSGRVTSISVYVSRYAFVAVVRSFETSNKVFSFVCRRRRSTRQMTPLTCWVVTSWHWREIFVHRLSHKARRTKLSTQSKAKSRRRRSRRVKFADEAVARLRSGDGTNRRQRNSRRTMRPRYFNDVNPRTKRGVLRRSDSNLVFLPRRLVTMHPTTCDGRAAIWNSV
jgi:hypothetical protein